MKAHYYTLQQDHYDDVEEDSDDDHPDRPIPRRCWSPITHSLTHSVSLCAASVLCCASVSVPVPVPACVFLCRARESLRMPSVARRRTGFSLSLSIARFLSIRPLVLFFAADVVPLHWRAPVHRRSVRSFVVGSAQCARVCPVFSLVSFLLPLLLLLKQLLSVDLRLFSRMLFVFHLSLSPSFSFLAGA